MKLLFSGCTFFLQVLVISIANPALASVVNITLHLNYIYEITPVEESLWRGLAIATVRQQLLTENLRTYTILAGDALSPSALGIAKVKGKPLAGEQMVAVMNAVNFNSATFGDRKKNLSAKEFQQRLHTDKIPADPSTAQILKQSVDNADRRLRAHGFVPEQAIATTNVALDGLNSSIRDRATNLTALIVNAILQEVDKADLAIFNSGAIQIDDYIPPGIITQHDIIRILPNGSKILAVEMNGSLLQQVLEQGQANRGTGGYLQTANVSKKPEIGTWVINGEPLDPNQKYRVAINDLLMSGKEKGLEFLNFNQPGVRLIAQKRDIRFAVIEQLKDSVFGSTLMKSR